MPGEARARPETLTALADGKALYDAGHYFEAHEVWEDAWREESGPIRQLLQGLILVSGGFVKARRDSRPAGAVKLLESAQERLAPLPDGVAGVALVPFRAELTAAILAARRWRDGEAARLEAPAPRLEIR